MLKKDAPKAKCFTTQRELLMLFSIGTDGVCAQLTNAYVRSRLNNQEPKFLQNIYHTFDEVMKEAEIQDKLINANKDTEVCSSAFSDRGVKYKAVSFSREEMTNANKFKDKLGKSRFGIFSKPTRHGDIRHLVAFEQESTEKCRFFDPDLPGGEYKGSCSDVYEVFTKINNFDYPSSSQGETKASISC